ncbi:hypothetical protein BGX29_011547 [Mortierella sp. GBA35]|nr:hypothetical protein BGX29_011547 [Mortierella sp. GBA35]
MEPDLPVNYVPQNICRLWWDRFAAAVTAPTALGNKEVEARDTITTTAAIISNGSQVDPTTPPSCLLHSIRHLEFRGTIWGYTDAIPNLRGHLQFIETLTLEIRDSYGPVPLFKVLEDLPSLKSISIKFEYYSRVQLLHGDDDDHIIDPTEPWIDPETAHFPRKPWVIPLPKMFSDQYRLQRFDINGVVTHLRVLERVLVTCPELRVFKIKNIDINMYLRESSDDAEDNARQRLIDLATKHCPKLEWYAFHLLQHTATDDPDLATIGRCFPDQKFMSLTFGTYQESIPSTPMARDTLSRITVLEVKTCPWVTMESFTMNRVLCRAPNLLHLVAPNVHFSTNSLWQPPEPPQSEPPRYFATVRERKRHERSERRQIRQQALARFQSSSTTNNNNHNNNGSDQDDTTAPDANSSGPVTWQLYNLKTLDMSILGGGSMEQFTQYINQHRLFRNLVSFKLALLRLRIGQQETFADPKKPVTTATSSATPGSTIVVAGAGKRQPQVPLPPSEPARFPNDLLPLNTLRCLEEGILLPRDVPGLVLAKDFTFLQRKADFQTMSFLPTRRKSTEKSLATTAAVETTHPTENHHPSTLRKKKNKIGADESVLSSDDDDDEEDEKDEEERLKTETFWPRLHTFHVYYTKMSPIVSASKLVSGMERIRPGVSFKFQTRSNA